MLIVRHLVKNPIKRIKEADKLLDLLQGFAQLHSNSILQSSPNVVLPKSSL